MARVLIDLRSLDRRHPNAAAVNAQNLASALLRRGDHEYSVLEPGGVKGGPAASVVLLPAGGRPHFGARNLVLVASLRNLLDRGSAGPLKVATQAWGMALTTSRADVILAPSEAIRGALMTFLRVPPSRISISPPGLEPGFERVSLAEAGAVRLALGLPERYVLLFGDAPGPMLDGWEEIGREREGVQLVRASRLPDLDRHRLRAVLSAARACAFCGPGNGLPLGPLEAMACGSPPVVIGDAAYPEVVRDGGLVVRPAQAVADWRDSLAAILRSPKLRADLSGRGRALAAVFTADRSAQLLAPLLAPGMGVDEGVDPG